MVLRGSKSLIHSHILAKWWNVSQASDPCFQYRREPTQQLGPLNYILLEGLMNKNQNIWVELRIGCPQNTSLFTLFWRYPPIIPPIKKLLISSYFGCIIPHVLDTDLGFLSRASPCLQYRTTSRKRFLAKRDMDQSWMARRKERWGVWSCCAVNVAGWEIHEVNRGFFLPGKSS